MIRYVAQITIEADTPLKIGSNATDFFQDSPVQTDFNNLAMILGTSITGVLRKEFEENEAEEIFGKEKGSKVIISNALLLDENNKVNEELLLEKSSFLKLFENLPIREHTAINDKGVTKEHSKFDEEVVFKGSRFKFSIEFIEDDETSFKKIINLLANRTFRIGGGSTKGFGKIKVLDIEIKKLNLDDFINYSSSLNYKLNGEKYIPSLENSDYTLYELEIKPDDFFMFGSGFADETSDMTPVFEKVVDYSKKDLSENEILIPASSLKGAISHRTTYHFNKLNGFFDRENAVENVVEIFGEAKQSEEDLGQKGHVIFSDCFKENPRTKIFDHVKIDRFTGGAMEGALFQEKTIYDDRVYKIEIFVKGDISKTAREAFENSLNDICNGMLPLGGATTKGHGVFRGKFYVNGEQYEKR